MVDLANIRSLDCQNIGDGLGLFANNSGGLDDVLSFKTLIGGPGIILNADDSTITIEYVGMANGGAIPFSKILGAPSSIAPLGLLYGTPDSHLDFIQAPSKANTMLAYNGAGFQWTDVPVGTVTDVAVIASQGTMVVASTLTPNTFQFDLSLPVISQAGTYTNPTIEIDAFGRVISATSTMHGDIDTGISTGTGAAVYSGKDTDTLSFRSLVGAGNITVTENGDTISITSNTVTSVDVQGDNAIVTTGGPITTSGTINVALKPTGVQAGTYTAPTILVDEQGRITAAMSNSVGEIASARSLGSGTAMFTQKVGTEFQFRSIKTQGGLTCSTTDEEITLSAESGVTRVEVQAGPGIVVSGSNVVTSAGTIVIGLAPTGVTQGTFKNPILTIGDDGRVVSIFESTPAPIVTIDASAGITVQNTGTAFSLGLESITTPGTFSAATISIDQFGRVTAASETVTPSSGIILVGDVTASGATGSPVQATLADTGVVAGSYTNAAVTVDAKGRVTSISSGDATPQVIAADLPQTGVAAGTYQNPTITVDPNGRIVSASSSASTLLPSCGNMGDVLTMVSGKPAWASHPAKIIPADLPACQSWRLTITELDGPGLMAIQNIVFRSTVGGSAITIPGTVLCDDPGWGTNAPANAFGNGLYVATATFTPSGLSRIGFTFESSVVVRDLSITAGVTGYNAPIQMTVECLIGDTWETAWLIDCDTPWALGETRAFPSTNGPADEAFRTLADTPNTYLGFGMSHVRVKQDETGLEFVKMPVRQGSTQNRPDYHDTDIGVQFFDTSLNKPIWWTGSSWVDAMGTGV